MRALLVLMLVATPCAATPLYLLGARGPTASIQIVDQQTGAATLVVPLPSGPGISWGGLAHRPGDDSSLYTIQHVTTSLNPGILVRTAIYRVDLATGATTEVFDFDSAGLAPPNSIMTTLAIDPVVPNRAVVSVNTSLPGPIDDAVFTIDLDTGAVTSPLAFLDPNLHVVLSMTFSLDGSTLLAGTTDEFMTLDPLTGVATNVNPMPFEIDIAGLAFRPSDGALFGIHAYNTDALVLLDPSNGNLLETIGPTGLPGPTNITFAPEPSTALLVLGGLIALRMRRVAHGSR